MTLISPSEYDALTRTYFQVFVERAFAELNPAADFADNFHIGVICAKLEAVRRGEIKRLIINVPPRGLKSIIASVAFPAFVLGLDPTKKVIAASYGQELADNLARDCRQVMLSAWFRRAFPGSTLSPDRRAVHEFETTLGGGRLATSVGGAITGLGADIIIIDDPTKPSEALSDIERAKANQWYSHTLVSRLNNKVDGAIVLVMQRLHEDDLVGHVLGLEDWEVVSFPAIAEVDERHEVVTPHGTWVHERAEGEALHPAREPLAVLEQIRRTIGTSHFAAQYLQTPTPLGGGMIKEAWFVRYDPSQPPKFERIIQSWDTANKAKELSDFSVCTTWGVKEKHYWLLNVFRKRLEYPDLKRAVREQAKLYGANSVVIENHGSGVQLIQELLREGMSGVTRYEPKGDKVIRMDAQSAAIEGGLVHLPTQAHWLEDYLHELMVFPKGRHDDQVDSTSQALDWARNDNGAQAWLDFYKELAERRYRDPVPTMRVRHNDLGMTLQTITGRQIRPDDDGTLLLTEDEWVPSLVGAGFSLVED
jgi:predicted phage terminase large subunit-like protein